MNCKVKITFTNNNFNNNHAKYLAIIIITSWRIKETQTFPRGTPSCVQEEEDDQRISSSRLFPSCNTVRSPDLRKVTELGWKKEEGEEGGETRGNGEGGEEEER